MHKLVILIDQFKGAHLLDEGWPEFLHHAEQMAGLIKETHSRVEHQLFGSSQLQIIHELFFESREALQAAMASPQGQAAGKTLQSITQGNMSLFIAEHREDVIENLRKYNKPMRTPTDLQAFMDAHSIAGEIIFLDTPTPTVESAAQAVGTAPERIVKSVLFTIDDQRVLAIAGGTQLIDRRIIADLYGAGRKRVKLASSAIVLETTGYPVGTVPPFGHVTPSPTLLDPRVLEFEQVYAGGGAHNALVRLNPQDIAQITDAKILALQSNHL